MPRFGKGPPLTRHLGLGFSYPTSSKRQLRRKIRQFGEDLGPEIKRYSGVWGNRAGAGADVGTSATYQAVSIDGYLTEITQNIVQGITSTQRVGDDIFIKNINFRFNFLDTTTTSPSYLRVMMFYGNGDRPTIANLKTGGFYPDLYSQCTPFRRDITDTSMAETFTFNCLYDKTFFFVGMGGDVAEGAQPQHSESIRVPLFRASHWPVGETTGVADVGWFMVYMVSTRLTTTTSLGFTGAVDVYFTDPQ